jgi:hypothetical protein
MADQFFELPVIGLLFIAALSPLLIAAVPALRRKPGIAEWCGNYASGSEKGLSVTIIVAVAFIVGMLANQLVDAFLDPDWLPGAHEVAKEYKAWATAHAGEVPVPPPTLKLSEFQLADSSEYTRTYVIRHRTIIRVLRCGGIAAALALLAMAIHECVARAARTPRRYRRGAFIAATLALALFCAASVTEHRSVYKRVAELMKFRHIAMVLERTSTIPPPNTAKP